MSLGSTVSVDEAASNEDAQERAFVVRNVLVSLVVCVEVVAVILMLDSGGVLDVGAWWTSLGPWWLDDGWPWTSDWLTSPGFGGMAAVVAAALALAGARHQARLNAWWQRVEWAVTLYVNPQATEAERQTGASALEYLQGSRLARADEKGFVGAVMAAVTLDPLGNGLDQDDWGQDAPGASLDREDTVNRTVLGAEARRRPARWRRMFLQRVERRSRQRHSDGGTHDEDSA